MTADHVRVDPDMLAALHPQHIQVSRIGRCRHASRSRAAPAAWVGSWLAYRSTVSALKGTAGRIDPSALMAATVPKQLVIQRCVDRDDGQDVGGEGERIDSDTQAEGANLRGVEGPGQSVGEGPGVVVDRSTQGSRSQREDPA